MKFYESGDNRKPVIFLFPGTCCQYSSFDHVLDGLHSYFYTESDTPAPTGYWVPTQAVLHSSTQLKNSSVYIPAA